ncbi:MAG: YbhB/YbcL family Raf kinase inhibitor-like protein [Pseudomonadota bacterium]
MPLNIKNLKIDSPDFKMLGLMDDRHAGDKGNVIPRLMISGVPSGTVELAVICHDPDAPLAHGFTHWTLYNVPPSVTNLENAEEGYTVGPNGAGQHSYYGPQPPASHGLHHYYFWVYALDTKVDGTPTREQFLDRYGANVIEQARLVGTYKN